MKTFNLSGKIIRNTDRQPIPDLYLEVWDKDKIYDDLLGTTYTNEKGEFTVHFNDSYYAELFQDCYPDVYFKIFADRRLIASTEDSVVVNLQGNISNLAIAIDFTSGKECMERLREKEYTVRGRILDAGFLPAVNYMVEVIDKGIIKDIPLRKVATDQNGYFETRFSASEIMHTGKKSPDLYFRIGQEGGRVFITKVIYNVPAVLEIQEVLGDSNFPRVSEIELIDKKVMPLLNDIPVKEIKENEIANPYKLISENTGEREETVRAYVTAHQLAAETKLPVEFYYALLAGNSATPGLSQITYSISTNVPKAFEMLKTFRDNEVLDKPPVEIAISTRSVLDTLIENTDEAVEGAIEYAIKSNVIPARIHSQKKEILRQWAMVKKDYLERRRNDFNRILETTRVEREEIGTITELFDKFQGNVEEVLGTLSREHLVRNESLIDIKTTFELRNFIKDPDKIVEVKTRYNIYQPAEVRRLAKLSEDEWVSVLNGQSEDRIHVEEVRKEARSILVELEERFPTMAFTGKLERDRSDGFVQKEPVTLFLNKYSKIELHKTNIDLFFNQNKQEINSDFGDSASLRKELKKIQRVFRLTPSYEKTKVLLQNNIHSSQAIHVMGKNRFMEKVAGEVISNEEAERIYKKAEASYAASLAILGDIKSMQRGSVLNVLPDGNIQLKKLAEEGEEFADLKTLFSSSDVCECEHCRSVYSPAAYLTDIIKYLDKRGSKTPMISAKEILFKRRPDIGEIDLNCENTNTAIPYIDLVCETLEDALYKVEYTLSGSIEPLLTEGIIHSDVVNELKGKNLEVAKDALITEGASGEWFIRDKQNTFKIYKSGTDLKLKVSKQTHGSATERRAIPEFINYKAYEILKDAKHPSSLPFDLSLEEVRAYLDKIGVNRAEFMEAFVNKSTSIPTTLDIASEYLGLSVAERTIIITPDPGGQSAYWDGLTDITKVSVFLDKSGLEYKQLEELLGLYFIKKNESLTNLSTPQIQHTDTTCNTDSKNLLNINAEKLDRINRFLRLWRKTGFSMNELDLLISSPKIGNGEIDADFLIRLKDFIELKQQLKLSVEDLLAYYADLNIIGDKSIYKKLFRNKVILDPLPDAYRIELVTETPFPGTPPVERTISGQLKALAAVLKLKEDEAELIKDYLPDDDLSLGNISIFYRIASLTRKLKISVQEFDLLNTVLNTGSTLNIFNDPASTKKNIEVVDLLKSVRISAYELSYLLLDNDAGKKPIRPSDQKITDFINKVRQSLDSIKSELENQTGLPDEIAKNLLAKVPSLTEEDINTLVLIFNGTFSGNTTERDTFLDTTLSGLFDVIPIKGKLNDRDAASPSDKASKTLEAYEFLNTVLIKQLRISGSNQALFTLHSEELKLSEELIRYVLMGIQLAGSTDFIINHFLSDILLDKDSNGNFSTPITPANFPAIYDSYRLIHKIALVQNKVPVSNAVFELLLDFAGDFNVYSYDSYPITSPVADAAYDKFSNYIKMYLFASLYPDNENGTLAWLLKKMVPAPVAENEFMEGLAEYTGWDQSELMQLKNQLGLVYPDDFKNSETYLKLDKCIQMLTRPQVKVSQLPLILKPEPLSEDAISVKQLVKSKYDNSQWLNTSGNIQGIIREKKRKALVDYYTHHEVNGKRFKNSNDLYSYYLLDVEMSACEVTTRILQAYLSVQLFVQRCLMNIEEEIVADDTIDDGWKEWAWMKNYRVWEANRKVFLYPENWIEPELRPDKSYFFKEMENELMQNEINKDNVEKAFLNYLEKLDNVARLDVSGFYYEHETYTLHVFARTYDEPHIYYYRKWIEDRYWTPWEKVDVEIATTHVIPLVMNRRLYLFWPDFREKASELSSTKVPNAGDNAFQIDKPYKYWEIRMGVSELRNKKWTPKKLSKSYVTTSSGKLLTPQENFSFIPLDLQGMCDKYLIGCFENTSPTNITQYTSDAVGFFELGGCHGTPEILDDYDVYGLIDKPLIPQFERSELKFLESQEGASYPNDVLAYHQGSLFMNHMPILEKTPLKFRAPQPSQLSIFDSFIVWIYWNYIQYLNKNGIKYGREWPFPYPTGSFLPFFYEDKYRTFFAMHLVVLTERTPIDPDRPLKAELSYTDIVRIIEEFFRTGNLSDMVKPFFENDKKPAISFRIKFCNFYHPHICFMIKQLYKNGVDGFMKREVQMLDPIKFPEIKEFSFKDTYVPTPLVHKDYPKEDIDFNPSGGYSNYNWELFFHAPLMMGVRLSKNQRFEEARDWFHYIFNPTDTSSFQSYQKYWVTKPFFERSQQGYIDQRIDQILNMINSGDTELIKQVNDWRRNAFQPHMIAKFRTVAYQKAVVMKYLDNLIDWADYLYRSDRREAINEATQLYILAAEILGPKPRVVPNHFQPPIMNYNQLEPKLDAFANAMVALENFLPLFEDGVHDVELDEPLPSLETFYYCIPQNDKILEYYEKVADRLFKIRHCMNIDGVERSLALFDPPIDPGLLVKAAASGVSLGAAISGLSAPLPFYKYRTMSQKALDICNEVKSLGASLLSALEKKDAEALALLRATHEVRLLEAVKQVRLKQVEEARENINALRKTRKVTEEKENYYGNLQYMNPAEIVAFALSGASTLLDLGIALGYTLAGGLKLIPNFILGASGFGGSPQATGQTGGQSFGSSAEDLVKTVSAIAHSLDKMASLASTQGSYLRRKEEWDFQKKVAQKELQQIDAQITASEVRLAITEKELASQEVNIENSKEVDEFMKNKFTNEELYDWMIGQISGVYFQSYQLAYDMARKAERSYQYELGLTDGTHIQFGYWDTLKKGLLAGEKLSLDLRKLDASYLDSHKREFELTKHISLSQLDPLTLLKLKQTGVCFFKMPEEIFDLDYPGHYFRRIKSVSVSIPCIVGPYTSVNSTLTLLKSRIRLDANAANVDYSTDPTENDPGFAYNFSSIQSIVTSNGQNDNGMFEANMNDERYLPFEGHGAISEWKLELNKEFRNFDLQSISDVVLHVRYTARQGGEVLGTKVKTELNNHFDKIIKTYENGTGLFKMLSMKNDFSTEFYKLLNSPAPHQVNFELMPKHVPYWLSGKTLEIDDSVPVQVFVKPKPKQTIDSSTMSLQLNGEALTFGTEDLGVLKQATTNQSGDLFRTWNIGAGAGGIDTAKVDDLIILIKYKIGTV